MAVDMSISTIREMVVEGKIKQVSVAFQAKHQLDRMYSEFDEMFVLDSLPALST